MKAPRGILGKLLNAGLKTIGGIVGGDFIAPLIKANAPLSVNLGSHSFNIPAELASIGAGLGSEYVKQPMVESFLDGLAGGLAAGGDPVVGSSSSYALMTNDMGVGL